MARVTLDINLQDGVKKEDLEKFLLFKFFGHGVNDETLSKFKHEELDVEDFEIDTR